MLANRTPLILKYRHIKAALPAGVILLIRVGDFYEAFETDAETIARELEITLTGREFGLNGGRVAMAGVPYHALDRYIDRLREKGVRRLHMRRRLLRSIPQEGRGIMLTHGSLFSGIEGMGEGFRRADIPTLFCVERMEDCRNVLRRHHPDAVILDDVTTAGAHNLPKVDILSGGFPCQDLSIAGVRAGLAGERSGLFHEMVRITNELRPMFLVWENVPGLLTSDDGRDFLRVLRALADIGYYGAWTGLDARYFGLAQRRRRIFGVFARGDIGAASCGEILSLTNRMYRNSPTSRQARDRTPGNTERSITRSVVPSCDEWSADVAGTLTVKCRCVRDDFNVVISPLQEVEPLAATLTAGSHKPGVSAPGRRKEDDYNLVVSALTTSPYADGGADNDKLVVANTLTASAGHHGYSSPRGDGSDNLVIATGERPKRRVRRLTPTECERLQGFPDGHTAYGEKEDGSIVYNRDAARYRMCGNSIATKCSYWIGRNILRYTQKNGIGICTRL